MAAFNCQLLCETISYISVFTGGGGARRIRVYRDIQLMNLTMVILISIYINVKLLTSVVYNKEPGVLLGFQCDYLDVNLKTWFGKTKISVHHRCQYGLVYNHC